MSYTGRTYFRSTRGTYVLVTCTTLIAAVLAAVTTITDAEWWVRLFCWAFLLLSPVAIAEAVTSYVTLTDDEFRMRKNFRTTVIPRDRIDSVHAAKGCPIVLMLKDGTKIEMPSLGGQYMENSLRSWVRAKQSD